MSQSPSTEPGAGPAPEAALPVRLLLVDAGAEAAAWRAALEAAGVAVRTRAIEDPGGVAVALREPFDLILVWDDAGGWRAPEVLAAVRREGFEVPVAVVADPGAETPGGRVPYGAASALGGPSATVAAILLRGRPGWLPGALARILRQVRLETRMALTGRIAHDLNNLLAPIPLAVQLLRRHAPGPADPGQIEAVDSASRGSMAAVKDLSELLVAREDVAVEVGAKHLLAITARHWRQALGSRGGAPIGVLTDYPPDLASVRVDVERLLQALSCLVRRALDGAPGGELLLQGRNVEAAPASGWAPGGDRGADRSAAIVGVREDGGRAVELRVACAPSGVEVFAGEVEVQAVAAEGLDDGGLEAIREVVEAHGGALGLLPTGRAGKGFAVLLPAISAGPRAPARASPGRVRPARGADPPAPPAGATPIPAPEGEGSPEEGPGRLVLVIDNDEECRRMTRATLEGFGFRVLTAGDGTEGVAFFAARPGGIAAVLVDSSLPYMDGPATLKALRRIDPTVPMILTTGAEWEARRIEHDPSGPQGVLRKPYDAEALRKALRDAMDQGPPAGRPEGD